MSEIGMQQRISDEGPDLGAGPARKGDVEQRRIVTLRNETEHVDGPILPLDRQQYAQMYHRQQQDIRRQRPREGQDRFARLFGRKSWRRFQWLQHLV